MHISAGRVLEEEQQRGRKKDCTVLGIFKKRCGCGTVTEGEWQEILVKLKGLAKKVMTGYFYNFHSI